MISPTARHVRIMRFLADYWVSFDRSPTLPEIAEACGLSRYSVESVIGYLHDLEREGLIIVQPRNIRIVDSTIAVPV